MQKLQRKLSIFSIVAISVGGMLGSGIFVLPIVAASKTGLNDAIWLAYLIAGIVIFPTVLSKSELATAMPKSGGTYVYIERAFGPIMGTISGIGLWLSLLLKSSFALIGLGAYLSVLIPNLDVRYISISFLLIIFILNCIGIKKVGKTQIIIVSISLIFLSTLLIFGLFDERFTFKHISGSINGMSTGSLIEAVAFVYISYAGVTKVAAIAGEIKDPNKNLPRAMMLSLVVMGFIYVSIVFLMTQFVNISESNESPIYTLSIALQKNVYFGYIASVLGVITLFSMANSGVLTSSRFPFAMAKDKLLPNFVSEIHPKHLTPITAISLTCVLMTIVILCIDVAKLAKLASGFKIMMFIAVNACVIVFRETGVQWYRPSYKAPLYPIPQFIGIISGVILLFYLGWLPLLAILSITIIGSILYLIYGRKTGRSGVLRKYGNRPALYMLYSNRKNYSDVQEKFEKEKKYTLTENVISDVGVVVPLLGNESSPEMLSEIGCAINEKKPIQTVHITEVPDQTFIDSDYFSNNPKVESIKRQIELLSQDKKIEIHFNSYVTHNLSNTIQALSEQTHCDWLVLGWNGVDHQGIFVNNPIGWLITHVDANIALFKDNGVRYVNRILLAIIPQKDNIKFVQTTDKMAKFYNATFDILHVIPTETEEEEEEYIKNTTTNLINQENTNVIIQKSKKPEKIIEKLSAKYDLLITGTPKQNDWASLLFGTGKDKFASNAACSVLRLTIKN